MFIDMFELIELPYGLGDLEPVISSQTLSFHHGKHLQGYVDNLNRLTAGKGAFEGLTIEEIVCKANPAGGGKEADAAVFNNAGQILNHNLYFTQFAPKGVALAEDSLLKAQIVKQWGSLEAFRTEFVAKGTGLFGSGWVWLAASAQGELVITQEPGASNPVTKGLKPLLTFDVWEHAYYLDYQNRRAVHLEALWQIVDWSVVEKRFM